MIADAVFAWGDRQPEKTALDHNGVCWSYRMFCDQIMRARGHFDALGLGGGGIVVVAVEDLRSSWTSSLALRSLGVTTVPVSSAWEIVQLGIPELAAVAALGAERWKGLPEVCAAQGLRLVPAYAGQGTPKAYDPSTRPGGHIMLSSGTTGVRKKVLMDPSFEVAYLRRRMRGNGIDHDSVVCVITHPPWTSVGYKHPAAAWLAGGTVVLSQGQPYRLALARPDLTECMLIPGMLADALAEPAEGFPWHETMRLAITAGTVTRAQIAAAKARISPIVVNSLAATEGNGIAVTPFETDEDHRWHRPLEGIIQVVDDDDRVLPPGRLGRLRVDTNDAPQGYLYDEEATRACFRDGFFYPGDLAIIREDGRIALMGRSSDVINVGGFKVSPAPIEDRLREGLGVSGVCLLTLQDPAGDEALHAVIETPGALDLDRLAAALKKEISGFAGVRAHFVTALPRNQTGKVLRQAVAADLARWQASS